LLNLAVNARDAMPGGGTKNISASGNRWKATPPIPAGDYVRLSVSDQGEGMDETTMQRAMEPFFTTKGVCKGTGLGLSIVHGVMKQSGGELVLKSEKGQGTTAELWLPVNVQVDPPAPSDSVPIQSDEPKQKSRHILAVDDDVLGVDEHGRHA
jgi:signal transduction histidine kinase